MQRPRRQEDLAEARQLLYQVLEQGDADQRGDDHEREAHRPLDRGGRRGLRLRQLDVEAVRRDFPALRQTVHGKPLAYLDNAASAQTPMPVLKDTILR